MRQAIAFVLVFVLLSVTLSAQALRFSRPLIDAVADGDSAVALLPIKCATPLRAQIHSMRNELLLKIPHDVRNLQTRLQMEKSRLSASGRFRVHYDTSAASSNTPALLDTFGNRIPGTAEAYADSTALIFDQVWTYFVDQLGFGPPPSDTDGGGAEYDIYIVNQVYYGLTNWVDGSPINSGIPERYSSWIEIENDFRGFPTPGLDGLRVTAAHEFHHAIQLGAYGIWSTRPNADFFYNELTSVWAEESKYDDINDYYFYLPDFFFRFRDGQNRTYDFSYYSAFTFSGYERVLWALFLQKRFGISMMRDVWQGTLQKPILQCLDDELTVRGTTFRDEFALFSRWNFYTGRRADSTLYYDEGTWYPEYRPNLSTTLVSGAGTISGQAFSLSAQYLRFTAGTDTLLALVANTNALQVQNAPPETESFTVRITSSQPSRTHIRLPGGRYALLEVTDMRHWSFDVPGAGSVVPSNDVGPSPNPLSLASDNMLWVPFSHDSEEDVTVRILSASYDKLFEEQVRPLQRNGFAGKYIALPVSRFGGTVGTGVVFIVVSSGSEQSVWKAAFVK